MKKPREFSAAGQNRIKSPDQPVRLGAADRRRDRPTPLMSMASAIGSHTAGVREYETRQEGQQARRPAGEVLGNSTSAEPRLPHDFDDRECAATANATSFWVRLQAQRQSRRS
jgi:hypothetical protein